MKKVQYKITDDWNDGLYGTIIDAFVIFEEFDRALLYHPKGDPGWLGCASIEMCELDGKYYVSCSETSYCNVESQRDLNQIVKNLSGIRYTPQRKRKVARGQ